MLYSILSSHISLNKHLDNIISFPKYNVASEKKEDKEHTLHDSDGRSDLDN